jgi:hypothetical protein
LAFQFHDTIPFVFSLTLLFAPTVKPSEPTAVKIVAEVPSASVKFP